MKQIFRKQKMNKLKKLVDEGATITAEDFQRKIKEAARKIQELFDYADQDEEEK